MSNVMLHLLLSPNLAFIFASFSISAGGATLKLAKNWNPFVLVSRITRRNDLNMLDGLDDY